MAGPSCPPVVTTIVEGCCNHVERSWLSFQANGVTRIFSAEAPTHCHVGQRDVLGHAGLWRVALFVAGLFIRYLAPHSLPVRCKEATSLCGDNGVVDEETVPYWKRLLSVSTPYPVSSPASLSRHAWAMSICKRYSYRLRRTLAGPVLRTMNGMDTGCRLA